jgi:hypothetical protein
MRRSPTNMASLTDKKRPTIKNEYSEATGQLYPNVVFWPFRNVVFLNAGKLVVRCRLRGAGHESSHIGELEHARTGQTQGDQQPIAGLLSLLDRPEQDNPGLKNLFSRRAPWNT